MKVREFIAPIWATPLIKLAFLLQMRYSADASPMR